MTSLVLLNTRGKLSCMMYIILWASDECFCIIVVTYPFMESVSVSGYTANMRELVTGHVATDIGRKFVGFRTF